MGSFHAIWLRWRWALLAVSLVFIVIAFCTLHPVGWKIMGVDHQPPAFIDMEALLSAGEAWAAGHDPYRSPNPFDSLGRPHIYGPAWLFTGVCGFTVAQIAEFGVLAIIGFLGSLAYWYRPTNWRTTVGVLASLLSPSVLLGLERANNDLIMVLLISLTAGLSRHQGLTAVLGVTVLMSTAAWLKIYPVVAGIALFTLPGGLWTAGKRFILLGLITMAGFALYADDYLRLLSHVPVGKTIYSYDMRYAYKVVVNGVPGLGVWSWLGAFLAVFIAAKILWAQRRDYWHSLPLTGEWAFFTVSAAAVWVGCLITAPSFPYRAVWVLPLLAWWASPDSARSLAGRALCAWTLFFLWVWWIQWQSFPLIYDCHVEYMPILSAVLGLTHASVILTTGLIAWVLLGWGWRRLKCEL